MHRNRPRNTKNFPGGACPQTPLRHCELNPLVKPPRGTRCSQPPYSKTSSYATDSLYSSSLCVCVHVCIPASTCTHVHTGSHTHAMFILCSLSPVLQVCFLQSCWKSLPIFHGSSTTGKDSVIKEILKQLLTRKEVVKEDMVVLAFQELSEIFNTSPLPSLPVYT